MIVKSEIHVVLLALVGVSHMYHSFYSSTLSSLTFHCAFHTDTRFSMTHGRYKVKQHFM